jgi:hypothetical protein
LDVGKVDDRPDIQWLVLMHLPVKWRKRLRDT